MNLHIWRCTIYIVYLEMQVEKDWSEFFFLVKYPYMEMEMQNGARLELLSSM